MTKEEIVAFINTNPTCFLATVEGDVPHVRAMGMYKADERGILIQLSTMKGMYGELVKNPRIELAITAAERWCVSAVRQSFLKIRHSKRRF